MEFLLLSFSGRKKLTVAGMEEWNGRWCLSFYITLHLSGRGLTCEWWILGNRNPYFDDAGGRLVVTSKRQSRRSGWGW